MVCSFKDLLLNCIAAKQKRLPWDFNSAVYQYLYPDVAISGLKPRKHYRLIGRQEGRIYKKTTFIKKSNLNPNLETIVFCFNDEKSAVFSFYDTLKFLSEQFNIIIISNVKPAQSVQSCNCDWFIINKSFDRTPDCAKELINILKQLPRLKFVLSNIYENGFFYLHLEKEKIASILTLDFHNSFGLSNLSRGLQNATRVVYTSQNCAAKNLYDYMYGYPDKMHILNAALFHVPFAGKDDNSKTVIGFGNISFIDGFDIFAHIANLYEHYYPESAVKFIWIKANTNTTSFDGFEQSQNWQILQRGQKNLSIVFPHNNSEEYYQKASLFFDTSRFSNNLSHSKYALMAGKVVLSQKRVEPLSSLFQKNNIDDLCLFSPSNYDNDIHKLHNILHNKTAIDTTHIIKIGQQITAQEQFIEDVLIIGDQAHQQIQQEQIDAKELYHQKEFDYSFWSANRFKKMSLAEAKKYIRSWKSGVFPKRPCAGFHPGIYAELNDLGSARKDPYLHYIENGKPNGPWQWDVLKDTVTISDAALNLKIALQIHAYYIDKLAPIITALLHNKIRPDLFISVKNDTDKKIAEQLLRNYPRNVQIQVSSNRGRDIGPLFTLFREQLSTGYDIIGHLHTKHSEHIANRHSVNQWIQYLMTNLLGDNKYLHVADTIIEAFYKNKDVNLIFPDDRNAISWVKNRLEVEKLAPLLGMNTLPNYINYPVGTMFWARSKILKPFFDLNLKWADYPLEPLANDGTQLHAIERLIGALNQQMSKRTICTMFGDKKR